MPRSDRWVAAGGALLGATLMVGAAAMITTAQAQDDAPPPPPPRPAPQPGQPGGGFQPGGPGFGGGFGGGIPRPGFGAAPVMTATERFVYVLRGNTLYQFDANGLRLVAQTELPLPAGMTPGGEGVGPGGRRRGGNRTTPGAPGALAPR